LADLTVILGTATAFIGFGGLLTYEAAAALGGTGSRPLGWGWRWLLLLVPMPPVIFVGQLLVNEPGRAPWVFPFLSLGVVTLPSLAIAGTVAFRYGRRNRLSLPVTRREWFSAIAYGAIGATTVAGTLNTLYLLGIAEWLVRVHGLDGPFLGGFSAIDRVAFLPRGPAVWVDLSPIAVVAPLSEELWKGLIVAVFAYRRGNAARAFLWGCLAGAGFNILETFVNSLGSVQPVVLEDPDLRSEWWLFATARAGTGAMHSAATGLAALGIYGLLKGKPQYLLGYPVGVLMHSAWNSGVYLVVGDQFQARSGPDAGWLDAAGIGLMALVAALALALLWLVSGRLRDELPLPLYLALGMLPSPTAAMHVYLPVPVTRLGRLAPVRAAPAAAGIVEAWEPERWDAPSPP
jgi:hypothetical protein